MDGVFSAPPTRGRGMSVTITGPYRASGPGDTPSRRRIFVCRPALTEQELSCARTILETLAARAFRRQVRDNDPSLQTLLGFYQEGRSKGTFEDGIQNALARLLVDPQFTFRMEHVPAELSEGAVYRLKDVEIATRLSFFLWSSIPDDTLLNLASAGKLSDPDVLEQQTRRMLADAKSRSLIDNFASEWMRLRELDNAESESPDFDGNLRLSFAREMQLFFEHILREDRSIIDVLDADYTFVVAGVERGVEAEEAEVRARVLRAGARRHFHAQAQRGVHRHRERDDPGPRQLLRVHRLDRDVHQRGPVPGALQEGGRPGHRERLVAQLVAGHEENVARLAHAASLHLRIVRIGRVVRNRPRLEAPEDGDGGHGERHQPRREQ
jgi:hypothetical protein